MLTIKNIRKIEKFALPSRMVDLENGDKIAVIGNNGDGKSTILSCIGLSVFGDTSWTRAGLKKRSLIRNTASADEKGEIVIQLDKNNVLRRQIDNNSKTSAAIKNIETGKKNYNVSTDAIIQEKFNGIDKSVIGAVLDINQIYRATPREISDLLRKTFKASFTKEEIVKHIFEFEGTNIVDNPQNREKVENLVNLLFVVSKIGADGRVDTDSLESLYKTAVEVKKESKEKMENNERHLNELMARRNSLIPELKEILAKTNQKCAGLKEELEKAGFTVSDDEIYRFNEAEKVSDKIVVLKGIIGERNKKVLDLQSVKEQIAQLEKSINEIEVKEKQTLSLVNTADKKYIAEAQKAEESGEDSGNEFAVKFAELNKELNEINTKLMKSDHLNGFYVSLINGLNEIPNRQETFNYIKKRMDFLSKKQQDKSCIKAVKEVIDTVNKAINKQYTMFFQGIGGYHADLEIMVENNMNSIDKEVIKGICKQVDNTDIEGAVKNLISIAEELSVNLEKEKKTLVKNQTKLKKDISKVEKSLDEIRELRPVLNSITKLQNLKQDYISRHKDLLDILKKINVSEDNVLNFSKQTEYLVGVHDYLSGEKSVFDNKKKELNKIESYIKMNKENKDKGDVEENLILMDDICLSLAKGITSQEGRITGGREKLLSTKLPVNRMNDIFTGLTGGKYSLVIDDATSEVKVIDNNINDSKPISLQGLADSELYRFAAALQQVIVIQNSLPFTVLDDADKLDIESFGNIAKSLNADKCVIWIAATLDKKDPRYKELFDNGWRIIDITNGDNTVKWRDRNGIAQEEKITVKVSSSSDNSNPNTVVGTGLDTDNYNSLENDDLLEDDVM